MSAPDSTIVLKFGGTSVASPERLRVVAGIVARYRKEYSRVIVVVSAMGQSTDELIELALQVSRRAQHPENRREMDMLLSTGERISMALLSLALSDLGVNAVSFTGSQSGIITDTIHGEARVAEIKPIRIEESLRAGKIVIVAGFQGVSLAKEITTLGRGGSDTSAVALAAHFHAERAVIFTDVDGFYSADPQKVKAARKHEQVGWDSALLAAHFGAQVLHPRCVEVAWKHGISLELRSSFGDASGTLIEGVDAMSLEGPKVISVASQSGLERFSLGALSAQGAQALLEKLRDAGVKILGWRQSGEMTYLVAERGLAGATLRSLLPSGVSCESVAAARIGVVGVGLLNSPEVQAQFFRLLRDRGVEALETEVFPTFISAILPEGVAIDELAREVHNVLLV